MRCPSCQKFVSFDEPEVEEQSYELEEFDSGEVQITGEYRLVLRCGECGSEELKETTFAFDEFVDIPEEHQGEGHGEYELSADDPSGFTETQTTDRQGKTIQNPRYRRTYYGMTANWTIACTCGDTIAHGCWEDKCQASSMEELV